MKKKLIALLLFCTAHSIVPRSVSSIENNISPENQLLFTLPSKSHDMQLSSFQKRFRSVVHPIDSEDSILAAAMEHAIQEANRSIFSVHELSKTFLKELESAGTDYIKKIMKQTLDVNVDSLKPAVSGIKKHIIALQQTLMPIEHLALKGQLEELSSYFFEMKDQVELLINSNFIRISAAITSGSFTGIDKELVLAFKKLFNVYPTLIKTVNKLKIKEAGLLAQHSFNESSELLEQVVILHSAAGKLGKVLIHDSLIKPIDVVKNHIRRLGNSIEFTASTSPVIVVAPPTTYGALLELFKTVAWGPGIYLKPMVEKEVELAVTLAQDMINKIEPISRYAYELESVAQNLPIAIQRDFTQAIKNSPLIQIPRAPQLLLEIVEYHIAKLKRRLNKSVTLASLLTQELSMLIASSSTLLSYVNQYMGATTEKPFVNNDIVRGIGFIAEDVDTLSFSIKDINAGLAAVSILGIG